MLRVFAAESPAAICAAIYTRIGALRRGVAHFNPAFDYDAGGQPYSAVRKPDPRIAKQIRAALGTNTRTVLNVGAGSGSYEPTDCHVVALEPSAVMRGQRPRTLAPALRATAENIPFDDGAFDAAMACLTVHHWKDKSMGLREMRRVTRGPVVLMVFDPDAPTEFWLYDYAPELLAVERERHGPIGALTDALGGQCRIEAVPLPRDCTDGLKVAFYARPEAFLFDGVRKAQSTWSFIDKATEARIVDALSRDLTSGAWDAKYGKLRSRPYINCQLRLIIAT